MSRKNRKRVLVSRASQVHQVPQMGFPQIGPVVSTIAANTVPTSAEASAEVGTVFAAIVLTTGPIWGKPIWGTWWTWDARLTSTLFLFFLLIGYQDRKSTRLNSSHVSE